MANLLSQLRKDEQARLLHELNYLNMGEIRDFCSERGIPWKPYGSQAQAGRKRVEERPESERRLGPADAR